MQRGSLLLTLDWQVASPMLYTREVEHLRPDVRVIDVNLLRRLWYFDYLKRAYPELVERSREKVDSFVAELEQWDADPKAYANDAMLAQRIASKFQNMLVSFVTNEIEDRACLHYKRRCISSGRARQGVGSMAGQRYQLVPHGLVLNWKQSAVFTIRVQLHVETRGLADGTLKFEPDDVVMLKVLPAYKTMLVNRGRYLNFYGHYQEATEAFKRALKLDPKLDLAREGLRESLSKLPASQ